MAYRTHGLKYLSLNPLKIRPEYYVWMSMKARCLNPNSQQYHHYGGRGIQVCDRWFDFENFFQDIGERPSSKHSIGRIDNDGNYELSNCRWETKAEQDNNKRQNVFYTYQGDRKTLKQWADYAGLRIDTLWQRLNVSKMPFEDAITTSSRYANARGIDKEELKELLQQGRSKSSLARQYKVTNKVINSLAIELRIAESRT